jgi:hypothetical protein
VIGVAEADVEAPPLLRRRALAALALGAWLLHAGVHVARGAAGDALWACVLADLLLAIGLVAGQARVVAVGTLWLIYGLPLWVYALTRGDTPLLPSFITHLLGPVVGLVAARDLGFPAGTWWRALAALLALQQVGRLVTDPALNVNLAHGAYPGWEATFSGYAAYWAFMFVLSGASFYLIERLVRRALVTA